MFFKKHPLAYCHLDHPSEYCNDLINTKLHKGNWQLHSVKISKSMVPRAGQNKKSSSCSITVTTRGKICSKNIWRMTESLINILGKTVPKRISTNTFCPTYHYILHHLTLWDISLLFMSIKKWEYWIADLLNNKYHKLSWYQSRQYNRKFLIQSCFLTWTSQCKKENKNLMTRDWVGKTPQKHPN